MKITCCLECEYRKAGCHDYCTSYRKQKDELLRAKEAKAATKQGDRIIAESIRRYRKTHRVHEKERER